MKIYNVIIDDRHCDTTPKPFISKDAAIDYARSKANEYCSYPEDFEESEIDGWLYHATYSCEGDSVWVTEHDVDMSGAQP